MNSINQKPIDQLDIESKRKLRKKNALDVLREVPDNLQAIDTMIKISRQEGNTSEEQKYLYEKLRVEPNNPKITMLLIRLARANNDSKAIKRLRTIMRTMTITSKGQIRGAISMAAADKDSISAGMLISKLNIQMKEKSETGLKEIEEPRRRLEPIRIRTLDQEILEKTNKQEKETPIQKARRIIYESEDISKDVEKIKALLEGEDKTEVALVLAELYFHTGMKRRAEKSLKMYKGTLEDVKDRDSIKLLNKAIELTKARKTLPYKWEEIWAAIEEKNKNFMGSPEEACEGR
ncbi:MAG: hypothetical protein HFJ54_03105 [Clostridia bacterium]|nr:hypothetical protein [Clostridia bacterium]